MFSARSTVGELVLRGLKLIQNSTGAHDIRGNSNCRVRDGFGKSNDVHKVTFDFVMRASSLLTPEA